MFFSPLLVCAIIDTAERFSLSRARKTKIKFFFWCYKKRYKYKCVYLCASEQTRRISKIAFFAQKTNIYFHWNVGQCNKETRSNRESLRLNATVVLEIWHI